MRHCESPSHTTHGSLQYVWMQDAHAENLANHQIWLPDLGDYSGDTLPVNRGRTVYFGIEFSLGKE